MNNPPEPVDATPGEGAELPRMYGTGKALIRQAVAACQLATAAILVGRDRPMARQLLDDAEHMFRLADRLFIASAMWDDEALLVSDPAVYAARYGIANEDPRAVADLLGALTKKLNEEAYFGSD